jgi:hypothetical protein
MAQAKVLNSTQLYSNQAISLRCVWTIGMRALYQRAPAEQARQLR